MKKLILLCALLSLTPFASYAMENDSDYSPHSYSTNSSFMGDERDEKDELEQERKAKEGTHRTRKQRSGSFVKKIVNVLWRHH